MNPPKVAIQNGPTHSRPTRNSSVSGSGLREEGCHNATGCQGITLRWESPCGRVVLYCGNALTLLRGLPDRSVDMVFTDPPYGHNNNNGGDLISNREKALGQGTPGERRPIAGDTGEANGLFLYSLYQFARLLKNARCCCCCCGGGGPDPQFARWAQWMDVALKFKQAVVWDKGKMGLGWHYRRSYEMILVAEKRGAGKARWFDETRKVENVIRPGDYGIKKIIPQKHQHPTEKPVALAQHFIGLHSQSGETILDSFMGSGTTGVAAVRTGRKFIGIEIDAEHFATARERIEKALAEVAVSAKSREEGAAGDFDEEGFQEVKCP